jgi:hypothetical protein
MTASAAPVLQATVVSTSPFSDQKPGTSGLRKKVRVFQQPNYTHNFIQATLNVIKSSSNNNNISLVVGGDGRFFLKEAIQIIIRLAAGNGVCITCLFFPLSSTFSKTKLFLSNQPVARFQNLLSVKTESFPPLLPPI